MKIDKVIRHPISWLMGCLVIGTLNQPANTVNADNGKQVTQSNGNNFKIDWDKLRDNPLFYLALLPLACKADRDKTANRDLDNSALRWLAQFNSKEIADRIVAEMCEEALAKQQRQGLQPNPTDSASSQIWEMIQEADAKYWQSRAASASSTTSLVHPVTKPSPDPQTIEADKWIRLIPHPSIVLILGKRGSGKSALGYRLLEHLHYTAHPYVVALPKDARKLLPDWVGMAASLEDVPPKSIILVDEGYLGYHARRSMTATSVEMSQILNLSRQREQTLIFVTQEARQIDRNVASSANVVIFKDLGILQLEFDRRELNKIATNAQQAFATITGNKKRWAYIYSPDSDFMGLMENSLPIFWRDKLSRTFATGAEPIARAPRNIPPSQRIEKAKELSRQGLSLGQIAKLMGASKTTIKNYLEGYPYKR